MTTEQVSGAGRRPRASLRALLACGVAAIVTVGLAGSATAYDSRWFAEPGYAQPRPQQNWQQQRYYYQQQQQQRPVVQQQAPQQQPAQQAKKAPPPPPEKPKGPLTIIVSIKQQHVTLFSAGEQIGRAPVSTGVVGHLTPLGVFSVIEKDRYHHSNIYSGAPMPFMQRLTMSGVALHEGYLPGFPASHGCIRMPGDFAAKLWDLTELGVRVIVSPEDVSPVAISSPYLFVAKKPGPSPVALRDPVPGAKIRLATSADATDAPTLPAQAAEQSEPSAATPAPAETPAEPQPLAAQPATTEPAAAAAATSEPAASATSQSAAAPAADEPATTGTVAVKPATMPEPVAAATDDDAGRAVTDLILAEQAKLAAQRAKDAEADKAAAYAQAKAGLTEKSKVAQSGKEFPEKPGPITVFISRQTGKLYVRKGFWPVFETAVKIADPDRPFGTHVFTALEAQGNEGAFRWNVVSIPNSAKTQSPQPAVNKFGNAQPQLISHGAVDPATVLERITIPAEALDRISSLMSSGASLILSDFAMSYETAPRGTDFVVLVPN